MATASTRLHRLTLAFWTALGFYLATPLSLVAPVATIAAADDNGLGAGGAVFAYNYVFVISIILAFIFGFAIRDFIHRRSMRARTAKKPAPTPKRA